MCNGHRDEQGWGLGRTRLLGRFVSAGPAKPREFGRTAMAFGKIWENSTCCFMPLYDHFWLGIFCNLFQCFSPSARLTQKNKQEVGTVGIELPELYYDEGSSIMTNKQHNLIKSMPFRTHRSTNTVCQWSDDHKSGRNDRAAAGNRLETDRPRPPPVLPADLGPAHKPKFISDTFKIFFLILFLQLSATFLKFYLCWPEKAQLPTRT